MDTFGVKVAQRLRAKMAKEYRDRGHMQVEKMVNANIEDELDRLAKKIVGALEI